MTLLTPASDGPISVDAPGPQIADLSPAIRHPARLTALQRLGLLDTPAEQAFDRLTRLAAKILHAPVALLSLVDGDRSFFKSSVGLPELWASRRETPLTHSVCQHVVATKAPLVINDARAHPLLSDNQAVAELRIVAYLGIPLVTSEGHALGTFAVIDVVPREWAPDDVTTLGDLAASAMTEIELRAETNQRLLVEQRLQLLESVVGNASAAVLIAEADPAEPSDPRIVFVNDAYSHLTGYSLDEVVGRTHQVLNSSETDRTQVDTIRTALVSWKPTRLNVLSHRKDGSTFWAELNIVPIADKAGRYSHWVVIQRDISEQKATETALRESEARFQNVIFALPAALYTTDREGRITFFNEPAAELFGCRPVLGKDPWCGSWRLFRPDGTPLPHDQCPMAIALREGRSVRGQEIIVERPDGTRVWVLMYPEPMRDSSGEIVGAVNVLVDITERKQSEALRASEERLRFTLDATQVGEWQLDLATGATRRSLLHDQIFGYDHLLPEWTYDTFLKHVHPDDREAVHLAFQTSLAEGQSYEVECRILQADGQERFIWAKAVAHFDGGKPVRVGGLVMDITERKQAAEALHRSVADQRRLALIAQRTDNAVILTDPQGRIEWVNAGFTSITEFSLEEVLGKTPGAVLQGPDTDPATVVHMRERLLQGQGFQVEIRNYAKSGRTYWLAIEVQPIRDDQGTLTQFMAIESDITERKRAGEMLRC